ncbi:hypothetical protein SADUNF_Sadunf01G0052300 [Salix dunnii]|uniref:Uncharacterized protein n=1 Tax=Salix dunnii TaxID=1413687 RepID=A0A835TM78_9ROSI|nr:hypothetical protein SADUNF_Sadunf01G0052300 [Salix dunnii]
MVEVRTWLEAQHFDIRFTEIVQELNKQTQIRWTPLFLDEQELPPSVEPKPVGAETIYSGLGRRGGAVDLEARGVSREDGNENALHYFLSFVLKLQAEQLETMEDETQLLAELTEELQNFADASLQNVLWDRRSIYKIPASVTAQNETAYMPQTVSFGPYHHDESHLKPMEEHKHRALRYYLNRARRPLIEIVESLNEEFQVLRDSYDMLGESWKDDKNKFLQMMILDGCFTLEIIRLATHSLDGYAANDPVFSSHGRLYVAPYIRRDMLLLENQLPMLVLYKLVALESDGAQDTEVVNKLVLNFCSPNKSVSELDKCLHVLDLYRKSLLQEDPARKMLRLGVSGGLLNDVNDIMRSATELSEAGIQFKKGTTNSLRDISFRGGVLELPVMVVDAAAEATFLNLIAFERLHFGAGNEVTEYVSFMHSIINNERDIALLRSRGIIQNAIGSDRAVPQLFNSLSRDIALVPISSLEAVQMQVNAYSMMPWNEWRANLIHTYFRNPCAIFAVNAALILFALTVAETAYSIIPYYNPNHLSLPSPPMERLASLLVICVKKLQAELFEAMEDERQLLLKVTEELQNLADASLQNVLWDRRSIYKIPASVTAQNETAYMPQTVSFGPYHHDESHLKPMEEHKKRALTYYLNRAGRPLQAVVQSLNEDFQVLRDSYDMLDESWKDDKKKFLQLMILDGCFMLEIIRLGTHSSLDGYAANDPVFSSHGKLYLAPYIRRDMLLLENQLPMLVLYKLVALESDGAQDEEYVSMLVHNFCYPNASVSKMDKCLHVLDLYRKSLLQEDPARKMRRPGVKLGLYNDVNDIMRSATELNEAGIQFKKGTTKSLRDISFQGGVLELPVIVVNDATEATFLNLIAFERFQVDAGKEVTSYVVFMQTLIANERDVALLHSRGIIQNAIGSDTAVCELFSSLSKDIGMEPNSSLEAVQMQVNAHCQKPWNEWRANLIHTYFRNPWAILAVIAAFIFFALTGARTVYSIIPYYDSNYLTSLSPPMGSVAPPALSTPSPPTPPKKPPKQKSLLH